jgi:hypothetical protein
MPAPAPRPNLSSVTLNSAAGESLEYTLKIQGARANFAWVDDEETTVLAHTDFGLEDQIVWQLQTAQQNGQVVVTVPQKVGYQRALAPGTDTQYTLAAGFITATSYTLTVKKISPTAPATITDVDLTPDANSTPVIQSLEVILN